MHLICLYDILYAQYMQHNSSDYAFNSPAMCVCGHLRSKHICYQYGSDGFGRIGSKMIDCSIWKCTCTEYIDDLLTSIAKIRSTKGEDEG